MFQKKGIFALGLLIIAILVPTIRAQAATCTDPSIFVLSSSSARTCSEEIFTAFKNPGKGWLPYSFRPITRDNLPWPGGPSAVDDTPLASAVYTNYLTWSDLEPTEGAYRWDHIDAFISTWKNTKKIKIGIMVSAKENRFGKDPIPAWVKSQIQGSFYTQSDVWEPKYTDPVFTQKYQNFLTALGNRYYNTPTVAGAEDWKKYIESVDINTFGVDGEWWSAFQFQKQGVSLNPYVGGTVSNTPITFTFDDLSVSTNAQDTFSRTVASGWGNADLGGGYYITGSTTDYSVNGSEGSMSVQTAATGRQATLANISQANADVKVKVKTDKIAVGGIYLMDIDTRQSSNGDTTYLSRLYFRTDGSLAVEVRKRVAWADGLVAAAVTVPGITYAPNAYYWLRTQVSGSNPTTINVKVWKDGTTEPTTWLISTTDSDPTLQDGNQKYSTLKKFVDQYAAAFSQSIKPELTMNIIGSSANGPTTLQQEDTAAVGYAVDQKGASMIRRMIGLGDGNLKPDEVQFINNRISTKRFDGEWGSFDGTIVWFDIPNDNTPMKYTYQAIDQALELGTSYLGWYKSTDYIICGDIPANLPLEELPEKSQCTNSAQQITTQPLLKLYPGTTETLKDYFQRKSGYNFYISESVYPQSVTAGQNFSLQQAWYQRAVAKLYKQHYLKAYLSQGSTTIPLNIDMNSLNAHTWSAGPSGPHPITSTFSVPSTVLPGTYTLHFAVVDASGNPAMNLAIDTKSTSGLADPINDYNYYSLGNITVTAPVPADTTAPTVSIISPLNNSLVSRNTTVTIQATAADISGILKVEFTVNGALKCTDTSAPYSCAWVVPSSKNIVYTLQAKAYDTVGNMASSTVKVTSK